MQSPGIPWCLTGIGVAQTRSNGGCCVTGGVTRFRWVRADFQQPLRTLGDSTREHSRFSTIVFTDCQHIALAAIDVQCKLVLGSFGGFRTNRLLHS